MPLQTGALLAFVATLCFSMKAIFVKFAYQYSVDAVTLLALRMIFALPFLMAALFWSTARAKRPIARRDLLLILALGFCGYYLSSLLDFLGLQYISAGLERLILFLYPTFVALIAFFVFKRPLGRRDILALILSYAGIALAFRHDLDLIGDWRQVVVGGALILACTFTYAIYIAGSGEIVGRVGALRFAALATLVASFCVLLQFAIERPIGDLFHQVGPVYRNAFAMALLSTVLPVFLTAKAIALIGAPRAAIIGSIGPIATILFAWALLDEPLSLLQMMGAALVLIGILIAARPAAAKAGRAS